MKKKAFCLQLVLAAMIMTACGADSSNQLDVGSKQKIETTQGVDQSVDTETTDSNNTEESAAVQKTSVKPVIVSDKSALYLLILNDDDTLVPFIGKEWDNTAGFECEYQRILSQYFDEENELAATKFWAYQYDGDTVITVANEVVGAAGPNKPEAKTTIYVYDISSESGITVALHSTIIDKYNEFNSSDYTYGFSERKFYTGTGDSIGNQYFECDEQAFKDSISGYGLTLSDETTEMIVREDLNSSQKFDVPVIDSLLTCIFEMNGRNAAFPDDIANVLAQYPVR